MLEEMTTVESRQDVAMTLVKIYLGQGLVVPFLDYLNTREVNHTSKNKAKTKKVGNICVSLSHCEIFRKAGPAGIFEIVLTVLRHVFFCLNRATFDKIAFYGSSVLSGNMPTNSSSKCFTRDNCKCTRHNVHKILVYLY